MPFGASSAKAEWKSNRVWVRHLCTRTRHLFVDFDMIPKGANPIDFHFDDITV